MAEKVKALKKHLEIVSQINLKIESLQTKIEELHKWRNMEKNVSSSLLAVKAYDIKLHTLATRHSPFKLDLGMTRPPHPLKFIN